MTLKAEWAIDSGGMRNNCFSKIPLVSQKYQDKTTYASSSSANQNAALIIDH